MRWVLAGLLVLASLVVPAGAVTPSDCLPTCVVPAANGGFVPPVTTVRSGGAVVWESLDATHVNADGVLPNDPWCFFVTYSPGFPSDPVVFETDGVQVTANGVPCTTAQPAAAGSFILPYWCVLHPQMRGAIVVTTA